MSKLKSCLLLVALGVNKRRKTMGNIADTSIFQEMQEEMEDFFEYVDNMVYEDGTEMEMTGVVAQEIMSDEEAEDLEMRAELSMGI